MLCCRRPELSDGLYTAHQEEQVENSWPQGIGSLVDTDVEVDAGSLSFNLSSIEKLQNSVLCREKLASKNTDFTSISTVS